ncbi:GyrI-like domain-containing protein [Fusibacter sp. 3D3]|uniref:AraC family transcriptional regulator n=1 Tax=Fusibacter sp. 3D3 TaxID=1048380 RepID=UPI000852A013|nr:GyrI-like domain-containing protein [Fusibacter sp. 3D3]GAU76032.1 transcriptional regulator [Fusibacter sp. 3D3]
MKPYIEMLPAYRIAYMSNIGPYGPENVKLMESLKHWAMGEGLLDDQSILLGIAQNDPSVTKPELCRYDTGLVISVDLKLDHDAVNLGNIVGGKYCVFKISHTAEAVQKAWSEMFPKLLEAGYQIDQARPILERYKAELVNNHWCEICVPIN